MRALFETFEIHGKTWLDASPSLFQSLEYFSVYCCERRSYIIITSLMKITELGKFCMLTCRYRPDFMHASWIFTNHKRPSEDDTVFRNLYSPLRYNLNTFLLTCQQLSSLRVFSIFSCLISIITQHSCGLVRSLRQETLFFHSLSDNEKKKFLACSNYLENHCGLKAESSWRVDSSPSVSPSPTVL